MKIARARAAALSVRFETTRSMVAAMFKSGRDVLTAREVADLYQLELEHELGAALAGYYDPAPDQEELRRTHRVFAESYRVASCLPCDQLGPLDAGLERLAASGWSAKDVNAVRLMIKTTCHPAYISGDLVRERLDELGLQAGPNMERDARAHILRARLEAQRRADYFLDPAVQAAGDATAALMRERPAAMLAKLAGASPVTSPTASLAPQELVPIATVSYAACASTATTTSMPTPTSPGAGANHRYLEYDLRPFSAIIDQVVDELIDDGTWSAPCDQQRRIARSFAWITGDKPLGDYSHLDVNVFKAGLRRLPRTFRFGSPDKGAMSRPFIEVAAALPPVQPAEQRDNRTINRDLSFMSTISRHLSQSSWRTDRPDELVLNFAGSMAKVAVASLEEPERVPWTEAHLYWLLHTPVYTGNQGAGRRLRAENRGPVWHDAAYWVPLLAYYLHIPREEACGLEVADVHLDAAVPHLEIRNNMTRSKNGSTPAGEKRQARRRALPLHPELLRLGFAGYVRAVAAEGYEAIFPELYVHAGKRGGAQFYAIAWTHMMNALAEKMPIPMSIDGKEADFHSIRTYGAGLYELPEIKQSLVDDIFGHARQGTGPKNYQKRLLAVGLEQVLEERRDLMVRIVPAITADVPVALVRLLPMDKRSRVGQGRSRKVRSDHSQGRA